VVDRYRTGSGAFAAEPHQPGEHDLEGVDACEDAYACTAGVRRASRMAHRAGNAPFLFLCAQRRSSTSELRSLALSRF